LPIIRDPRIPYTAGPHQCRFGTANKSCTIATLTLDKEWERTLRITRAKMANAVPGAEDVVLETVDKAQGVEYAIVTVDSVAVSRVSFPGKIGLDVVISRARYGLHALGIYQAWMQMDQKDIIGLLRAGMPEEIVRRESDMLKAFAAQLVKHWKERREPHSAYFNRRILSRDLG
jgi:hypothetical protein